MTTETNATPNEPAATESAEPAPERVAAGVAVVEAALAWQLDDAGRAAVRERVGLFQVIHDALRGFPLANADEPDFVFRAYRAEG
jgi:hypothetical protein